MKGPGISFQSLALSKKQVRNVYHTADQYWPNFILIGLRLQKKSVTLLFSNTYDSVAGFKIVNLTKTHKRRYLKNETFLSSNNEFH